MFEGVKPVTHMLGLVGDNITASLTPPMHEMIGTELGMSVAYRPIDLAVLDVGPEDLADIIAWAKRLGFTGLNITAPCKQQVLPLLDELSDRATALQAVNTVVFVDGRTVGYNTDWCGFANSFRRNLPGAPAKDELFGPDRVTGGTDLAAALATADGVVNATTFGMIGHQSGSCVPKELLRPDLWVADCVYLPMETQLLADARAVGCRTLDGGGMAAEQAAEAFRLFTGVEPNVDHLYDAFARLLASKAGN
jgi:shikimate dehydrogenase